MSQDPIQDAIGVLEEAARALAGQASELDELLESTPTSLADSLEGIDDKIASRVTGALGDHIPAARGKLEEAVEATQGAITGELRKLWASLGKPLPPVLVKSSKGSWQTFPAESVPYDYQKKGKAFACYFLAFVMRVVFNYLGFTSKALRSASETLGEAAGLMYLAQRWKAPVNLQKASDFDPSEVEAVGEKWGHVVAFENSGVVNLAWWDGKTLRIVECKGGTSRLATRDTSDAADKDGHRAVQGSQVYLEQIAILMSESPDPVKKRVGRDLQRALEAGNVDYVVVSAKLDRTVTVSRAYWDHPGWALAEQTERQPRGARS